VEARAYVTQTYISPFGAQPVDLVNTTQNRYTQQTYSVSPYIKGVLGTSNVTYQVRDDSYWSIATNFGDSNTPVPTTYANQFNASMNSPTKPLGWTLEYIRSYYDNGLSGVTAGGTTFTTQVARILLPYQVDPQVEIAPRLGYEDNEFPLSSSRGVVYGIGGQWNPSDRTHLSGFWEHRFFGASYSVQLTHRLPNASIDASFVRGITSYPQQALLIPAGGLVSQFLDSAFATRIPDPAERAQAVAQFLAQTGFPSTLTTPVSVYAPTITLQQGATVSLILVGVRNSISFTVFNLKSVAISGTGSVLPPAFQFAQNYTQTGGGAAYSHRLTGFTNFTASANYNRATNNDTEGVLSNARTDNVYVAFALTTQLGPKTTCSAGVNYTRTEFPDSLSAGNTSSTNAYVGISHTF